MRDIQCCYETLPRLILLLRTHLKNKDRDYIELEDKQLIWQDIRWAKAYGIPLTSQLSQFPNYPISQFNTLPYLKLL